MKSYRTWLLLLLALLLPLRGALAAGMLCPAAEFGVQVEAQLRSHAHAAADATSQAHHHEQVSAHGHAGGHSPSDITAHGDAGAADKCNLCSAFCSVTGLVSTEITIAKAHPVSVAFPQLHAPAPSFLSDGQERPPRRI